MTVVVLGNGGSLLSTELEREAIVQSSTETVAQAVSSEVVITQDNIGYILVEIETTASIVSGQAGPIGPQGVAGVNEDNIVYSKRIDFISDNELYRGEAAVGSLVTNPVWRIRKIVMAGDGDVAETWANGTAEFDKVWNNRLSYNYEA